MLSNTEDELIAQVRIVAGAREKVTKLKQQRDVLLEAWAKNNQGLLDDLTQAGANVAVLEQVLRNMTLRVFLETGNKSPVKGVGIREMTRIEYDTAVALSWALEHKMAVKLDVSAFEKIAKTSPMGFVNIWQEPQATIATDLSGFVTNS